MQSVRERILLALADRLRRIDGTDGYYHDCAQRVRVETAQHDADAQPGMTVYVFVREGSDTRADVPADDAPSVERSCTINVAGIVTPSDGAGVPDLLQAERGLADIERALEHVTDGAAAFRWHALPDLEFDVPLLTSRAITTDSDVLPVEGARQFLVLVGLQVTWQHALGQPDGIYA